MLEMARTSFMTSSSSDSAGKLLAIQPHSAACLPVRLLPLSWRYLARPMGIFQGK